MANISSASGKFTFDKNFYEINKELIEKYFEKAVLSVTYGIDRVKSTDSPTFKFDASGRWSMHNTLPWALSPVGFGDNVLTSTEKEQVELFEKLCNLLVESDAEIKFEYDDEETECEFFVHDIAIITPKKNWRHAKNQNYFLIKDYHSKDLGFNDKNIIAKGYEEGYCMENGEDIERLKRDYLNDWYQQQNDGFKTKHSLEEVVEALKNLANINSDYNGALSLWRVENDCDELIKEALKQR